MDIRPITETNLHDLKYVIGLFNSEYNWDGMYTVEEAIERINGGCEGYIYYQRNVPRGVTWIKPLSSSTGYMFNIYLSKRKFKNSGYKMLETFLTKMQSQYDTLLSYVDDWNTAAHSLYMQIGNVSEIKQNEIKSEHIDILKKYIYSELDN